MPLVVDLTILLPDFQLHPSGRSVHLTRSESVLDEWFEDTHLLFNPCSSLRCLKDVSHEKLPNILNVYGWIDDTCYNQEQIHIDHIDAESMMPSLWFIGYHWMMKLTYWRRRSIGWRLWPQDLWFVGQPPFLHGMWHAWFFSLLLRNSRQTPTVDILFQCRSQKIWFASIKALNICNHLSTFA